MSDELVPALHAPARLQIVSILARVTEAEFATIRDVVDISDSVLSKHLSALAMQGFVEITKATRDGRQHTWASLTRTGGRAFAQHMRALSALAKAAGDAAERAMIA